MSEQQDTAPALEVVDPAQAWETGPSLSLSPSRASDFMTCPLLYRFRVIDRIPEKPSREAVRGTVVHQVLEDLFDLPPEQRTVGTATSMLPTAWETVKEQDEALVTELFDSPDEAQEWLASAVPLLETYFRLVHREGWTPDAFREWFRRMLRESVFVGSGTPPR